MNVYILQKKWCQREFSKITQLNGRLILPNYGKVQHKQKTERLTSTQRDIQEGT